MNRDWRAAALCAQADGDEWFPSPGFSDRGAERICGHCDVRPQCLEFALATDQRFGVFGGLSAAERRRLTREVAA